MWISDWWIYISLTNLLCITSNSEYTSYIFTFSAFKEACKKCRRTGKLQVTNFQFLDEKMIDRRESLVYYQAAKYHCTLYTNLAKLTRERKSWTKVERRERRVYYIYIYKYRSQRAKQQKPRQLRAWKSSRTLVAMRSTCRNVYLQFSTIVTMGGWIMEASEHIRTSTSRVNNWKTNVKVSSITKLVALANAPARRAATFLWNMFFTSLTWASSHRLRTQCFNRRATREETRRVAVSIFHGITISKLIRRSKLLAIKHVSPTLIWY